MGRENTIETALFPLFFFIGCAFALVSNGKSLRKGSCTILQVKTSKPYQCGLIELLVPTQDQSKTPQHLINDGVLLQGVRDVAQTLFVYVRANPKEPDAHVREYISSVYERLWDEMLQAKCIDLNCVVIGDVDGADYIKLDELIQLPSIQALYTPDALATESARKRRRLKGLDDISVIAHNVSFAPDGIATGDKICYLDTCDAHVPKFSRVAVGGTFDQLHNGHKKLLTLAAGCCKDTLVIGITGEEMLKKKVNAELIDSYYEREKSVTTFMAAVKPALNLFTVEITDPYGPTITDKTIEAIVVSSETIAGALKINDIRRRSGMSPLTVLVTRRSEGATLSSTFLRNFAQESKPK